MPAQLEPLRRWRRRKPSPPLEIDVCAALVTAIRYLIQPGWIFSHLPFGEHRNAITGARLKRLGTARGWPDYEFIGPHGATFRLELKRGVLGRLSIHQKQFAAHMRTHGHDYVCARSYDEAVAALVERGIIRPVNTWGRTTGECDADPAIDRGP